MNPPPGPWGPGGQPPFPPQQPPPPPGYYPPQPGWGGPPPPPPKQSNTTKWLLAGIGVLLVIAITVGVTVLVTRDGSSDNGSTTSTSASGPPIASADDDGPVEIITVELTCQAWMPTSDAMSQVQRNGWGGRDPDIPATKWTSEERSQYEAVAKSLQDTADQAVVFARQTTHRTIREMYEQFIYYARAYADSVADYVPTDNYLAIANVSASYALDAVCESIRYGSAATRTSSVTSIEPPLDLPADVNTDDPQPVVAKSSAACADLTARREKFVADTTPWTDLDPNVPASAWTPDRIELASETVKVFNTFADELEGVSDEGASPTFHDLASFAVVYIRAYANSLPTYVSADSFHFVAGTRAVNLLVAACQAASE